MSASRRKAAQGWKERQNGQGRAVRCRQAAPGAAQGAGGHARGAGEPPVPRVSITAVRASLDDARLSANASFSALTICHKTCTPGAICCHMKCPADHKQCWTPSVARSWRWRRMHGMLLWRAPRANASWMTQSSSQGERPPMQGVCCQKNEIAAIPSQNVWSLLLKERILEHSRSSLALKLIEAY